MSRGTKRESVGKKVIAALLMIVALSVLIPTRGAEIARSNDQLRACRDYADAVAIVGHLFVLEISKTGIYRATPEEGIGHHSPTIPTHQYRAPPVFS